MAKDEDELRKHATGPPGPVPHANYCTPQCYKHGKRRLAKLCKCKGCGGDAHGRGKKYAFESGYLKYSLSAPRKPIDGQDVLFAEKEQNDEYLESA